NGTFIITGVTDSTHFTYTAASGLASGSGGTASLASTGGQDPRLYIQPSSAAPLQSPVSPATESGNTVTSTTPPPNKFATGQTVNLAGGSVAGYNGLFTIASVVDSTPFTYSVSTTGLAAGSGGTATVPVATPIGQVGQNGTINYPVRLDVTTPAGITAY